MIKHYQSISFLLLFCRHAYLCPSRRSFQLFLVHLSIPSKFFLVSAYSTFCAEAFCPPKQYNCLLTLMILSQVPNAASSPPYPLIQFPAIRSQNSEHPCTHQIFVSSPRAYSSTYCMLASHHHGRKTAENCMLFFFSLLTTPHPFHNPQTLAENCTLGFVLYSAIHFQTGDFQFNSTLHSVHSRARAQRGDTVTIWNYQSACSSSSDTRILALI